MSHQIQIKVGADRFTIGRYPKQGNAAGKKTKKIVGKKGNCNVKQSALLSFHNVPAGVKDLLCGKAGEIQHNIIYLRVKQLKIDHNNAAKSDEDAAA